MLKIVLFIQKCQYFIVMTEYRKVSRCLNLKLYQQFTTRLFHNAFQQSPLVFSLDQTKQYFNKVEVVNSITDFKA